MFMVVGGLLIVLCALVCCFVILLSRPVNWIKFVWGFFCLSVAAWGYGLFRGHLDVEPAESLFWFRLANFSATFIALFFLHFCFLMTDEWRKQKKVLFLYTFWALIVLFGALLEPQLFIKNVRPIVGLNAYPVIGPIFTFYVAFFFASYIRALVSLFFAYRNMPSLRRQQFRYIFLTFLFAFSWGGSAFLPMYGILIPPYGVLLVPIFLAIVTWITVRYQLVDVRVFLSRIIFLFSIYVIVLGTPFIAALFGRSFFESVLGANWWAGPLCLLFLFATAGPFILLHFVRGIENMFEKERMVYQEALIRAADRVNHVKGVDFLSRLVVHVLTYSLKVEYASVYVCRDNVFSLMAHRSRRFKGDVPGQFTFDSYLVRALAEERKAVLADEAKLRGRDYGDDFLISVSREFDAAKAALALPCWVRDRGMGIILLGPKLSGRVFSTNDIKILSVLAGQVALAMQNSLYLENLTDTRERLIESEKMATIGFLVGGLAHQLKNRFTSLVFFSDFASRKVAHHRGVLFPEAECDETLSYIGKITDGVHSSKQVVNGVLNYASDREVRGDVSMSSLVAATLELIEFKIPSGRVVFDNRIGEGLPAVRGNFAQLQEVFFNMVDNAYDAMMEKKNAGFDAAYEPRMSFEALPEGDMLHVTVLDNGMGITPENMRRLFTPLFSTKRDSRKGHGLGLYIMRQIIEKNHGGRITVSSDYMQGVRIDMHLPLAAAGQFA